MHNTIIFTLVKDEDNIIIEWILHHLLCDIDHIYLFDDDSYNPVENIISILPNIYLDKITIYTKKNTGIPPPNHNKQAFYYLGFIKNHKNISKWCWFIDIDEFIIPNKYSINKFLSIYDKYDIINIPWLMYGSSYHLNSQQNGLLFENFTLHEDSFSVVVKSVFNLDKISSNFEKIKIHIHGHYIDLTCTNTFNIYSLVPKNHKFKNQDDYLLPIYINHYHIQDCYNYLRSLLFLYSGGSNHP